MERSRNFDVLIRREREQRQRNQGHEVIPESLVKAVEATRAEIERVLAASEKKTVRLKKTLRA